MLLQWCDNADDFAIILYFYYKMWNLNHSLLLACRGILATSQAYPCVCWVSTPREYLTIPDINIMIKSQNFITVFSVITISCQQQMRRHFYSVHTTLLKLQGTIVSQRRKNMSRRCNNRRPRLHTISYRSYSSKLAVHGVWIETFTFTLSCTSVAFHGNASDVRKQNTRMATCMSPSHTTFTHTIN